MSRKLIRFDDFRRVIEKIRQGYFKRILTSLIPFKNRTKNAWNHTEHPPKHWGSIRQIREDWNRSISGSKAVTLQQYVAKRYPELSGKKALSIACGSGSNEILWAKTGLFKEIWAFDISEPRIEEARQKATSNSVVSPLHFYVSSFESIHHDPGSFDVIIAENALHHAPDLRETIKKLANILKPGGYLILRDFVGPSRFQWSDLQIKHSDVLLSRIPERYRLRWRSNTMKKRFHRTGLLSMILSDPSEAVHSADIIDELSGHFLCKELKPLGGTLLQLVFDDIAQNFQDQTQDVDRILEMCMAYEKDLILKGVLPSDFVFGVFQLKVIA